MLGSLITYLIPVFVLGGLLASLAVFALLSRIQGGKYVRPLANLLVRTPVVGGWMKKASRAALERQNPELASAIRKLERAGVARDPMRAQKAMSTLTAAERQAYLDAAGEQGSFDTPQNRAMRRQYARTKKK